MDIEAQKRNELMLLLGDSFRCLEECKICLLGFNETLRADVVAISKIEVEPWILAFEIKQPTEKWELKNWLNVLSQAGNYPNCEVIDSRAGSAVGGLIHASFIYPAPDLSQWGGADVQSTRFYRNYDRESLRGAILLAQHFKVGTVNFDTKKNKLSLNLGTDPIWDNQSYFRTKSKPLLANRKIGSLKRAAGRYR